MTHDQMWILRLEHCDWWREGGRSTLLQRQVPPGRSPFKSDSEHSRRRVGAPGGGNLARKLPEVQRAWSGRCPPVLRGLVDAGPHALVDTVAGQLSFLRVEATNAEHAFLSRRGLVGISLGPNSDTRPNHPEHHRLVRRTGLLAGFGATAKAGIGRSWVANGGQQARSSRTECTRRVTRLGEFEFCSRR